MRAHRTTSIAAFATTACLLVTGSAAVPSPTRLDLARDAVSVSSAPRTVTVEVSLVAAIVESPTTIGISDSHLYNLSATDLERQLTLLKEAGVTDLRVGVPWIYVQPTEQTYDWSKMDALVNTATDMGFSITAAITGNTVWGSGAPLAGAPDPQAYAAFAGVTAERYKGKISAYEVWNEPNGVIFYAPVSPESYTKVLQSAYEAIKNADSDAKVIGGVLGATKTVSGVTMAPEVFLERMYEAGAHGYFDALSYHPYHYTLPFSQGAGVADSPMQQVLALRALMEANGDGDLKLWATEYGSPTTPFFGVSEEQQAAFMKDFIAAWQNIEGAGPAFLYSARDVNTGAWDNEANFGLFKSNWTPKKFVAMLKEIQEDLDDGVLDMEFTASKVPFAQEMFIQLASLALGVTNTALIIPRAIVDGITTLARQVIVAVVAAVRNVVSPPRATAAVESSTEDESADALTRQVSAKNSTTDVSGSVHEKVSTPIRDAGSDTEAGSTEDTTVKAHGNVSESTGNLDGEESAVQNTVEEPSVKGRDTVKEPSVTSAPSDTAPTTESTSTVTRANDDSDDDSAAESKAESKKVDRESKREAKRAAREAQRAARQEARDAKNEDTRTERETERSAQRDDSSTDHRDSGESTRSSRGGGSESGGADSSD